MNSTAVNYSLREVYKMLKQKEHQSSAIYTNQQKLAGILKTINSAPTIDHKLFKAVRIIVRFFRFPALILFQPIYQRIHSSPELIMDLDQDIKDTATIVKKILKKHKLPSLDFYLKGGYNPQAVEELKLPFEDDPHSLIKTVLAVETILNKGISSNERELLQETAATIKALQSKIDDTKVAIQRLCLEAYIDLLSFKKQELMKCLKTGKAPSPAPTTQALQTVQTQSRKVDKNGKKGGQPLCCRTFFYLNELIEEAQTEVLQYKNYPFPFPRHLEDILLKTMAGFLNQKGGIIYIGIKENNQSFRRVVVGGHYSQSAKQEVLRRVRQLAQRISPDIVNNPLYMLQFVPLKDDRNAYLEGKYLLRLRVQPGQNGDLYCFRNRDDDQIFAFRTPNQVLCRRMGQQVLETYRQRLANPPKRTGYINHPGPCQPPDLGKASYRTSVDYHASTYSKHPVRSVNNDQPKIKYKERVTQFFWGEEKLLSQGFMTEIQKFQTRKKKGYVGILPQSLKQHEEIQNLVFSLKMEDRIRRGSLDIILLDTQAINIKDVMDQEKILCRYQGRNHIEAHTFNQAMDTIACLSNLKCSFDFKLTQD